MQAQMQTPASTHTLDTSVPMDISQSRHQLEMHTLYNCSNKGHLLYICLKPQKQRIGSNISSDVDIKGLIAEAIAVAEDVRDVAKKNEQDKESGKVEEDFQAGQQ